MNYIEELEKQNVPIHKAITHHSSKNEVLRFYYNLKKEDRDMVKAFLLAQKVENGKLIRVKDESASEYATRVHLTRIINMHAKL